MTNAEENESNPGAFRRFGNKVGGAVESLKERTRNVGLMAQEEMQRSMLQNLMPLVKKMLPQLEEKLKDYLRGKDDTLEKAILMKTRHDGKLEILIFNAKGIEIINSKNFNPVDTIINKIELDEYIMKFLNGTYDKDVSEQ